MHNIYDVPELRQPNRNPVAILWSNVNSSVYLFIPHRKAPDQKPMHIGQLTSSHNCLDQSENFFLKGLNARKRIFGLFTLSNGKKLKKHQP